MRSNDGHADSGVSLARGPALVLGSILLAFGLLAFLADGTSPTDGFPDGTIRNAETFLGVGVNDWTAFFTAKAGGLLLFGAAQHLLAKTMSLIVGLARGACSVIALVDGDDVLGLAAANGWTKLGWGVAAAVLLVNALLPRKGGKSQGASHLRGQNQGGGRGRTVRSQPVAAPPRQPIAPEREPAEAEREPAGVEREPAGVGGDDVTRVREVPANRTGRRGRFGRRQNTQRGVQRPPYFRDGA
ncbi:MAG: DUF4383 domain-containing protein [Solirubrobacteraceae bacterium]